MDFFLLLDNCGGLGEVVKVVKGLFDIIKIAVPIILLIMGAIDLAKAVAEKDEGKIKDAQNKLVRRAITAVIVFLVASLVGVLMKLVGSDDYKKCLPCINHPFGDTCKGYVNEVDEEFDEN